MPVQARGYRDEGYGVKNEGGGKLLISAQNLASGSVGEGDDERSVHLTHAGRYVKVEIEGEDDPVLFSYEDMVDEAVRFVDDE